MFGGRCSILTWRWSRACYNVTDAGIFTLIWVETQSSVKILRLLHCQNENDKLRPKQCECESVIVFSIFLLSSRWPPWYQVKGVDVGVVSPLNYIRQIHCVNCLLLSRIVCSGSAHSPVHSTRPFPVNPFMHVQRNDPCVSLQAA